VLEISVQYAINTNNKHEEAAQQSLLGSQTSVWWEHIIQNLIH